MFDVTITKGYIVDGTGNPWFEADVGIKKGKVVAIGDLGSDDGDRKVNAKGRW